MKLLIALKKEKNIKYKSVKNHLWRQYKTQTKSLSEKRDILAWG